MTLTNSENTTPEPQETTTPESTQTPTESTVETAPAAQTESAGSPQEITARLNPEDVASLISQLQNSKQPEPTEPPKPEPEPPAPAAAEADPRDATMRSLLIKANDVPESLVGLIPQDPTEAQKVIDSQAFKALADRERLALKVSEPAPDAPKPAAQKGDASTAPQTPKTFKEVTTDHLIEISQALI